VIRQRRATRKRRTARVSVTSAAVFSSLPRNPDVAIR
jgi:hypothetical protein